MVEQSFIFAPSSKIEKDKMTIYGAGTFQESNLVIGKERAALLLIELYKFLEIK